MYVTYHMISSLDLILFLMGPRLSASAPASNVSVKRRFAISRSQNALNAGTPGTSVVTLAHLRRLMKSQLKLLQGSPFSLGHSCLLGLTNFPRNQPNLLGLLGA
jgi:hypothetical protein